jgi:hypothetical protein
MNRVEAAIFAARSNMLCLAALGAQVRAVAPPTLMPPEVEMLGATPYHRMDEGLDGADVVVPAGGVLDQAAQRVDALDLVEAADRGAQQRRAADQHGE